MKGYAQSQAATPTIDNNYMGKAVNGSTVKIDDDDIYGNIGPGLITAVYVVPFVVVIILLAISLAVAWKVKNVGSEDLIKRIDDEIFQANIISALLICSMITVYCFVLDVVSFIKELKGNFPSYYERHLYGINWINILSSIVSLIFLVIGIIISINVLCRSRKSTYFIVGVLIFGSSALSLSFHFPNILMAWATDPFYASRIGLFYGSVFVCYFTAFHYAYRFSFEVAKLNDFCKDMANKNNFCSRLVKWTHFCIGMASITVAFALTTGLIVTFVIFVVNIPVNNSIESSTDGVTTIYNGAIVLIGILLAYKIGGHFLNPFSLEDALKEAMKQLEQSPFDTDGQWKKLTEEKRMTEVVKALIHCQVSMGHQDTNHGGETKILLHNY